MSEQLASELRFAPMPGAAPARRMVAAQALMETRQLLRNGEQLTLTLIIPLLLLAAFSLENLVSFDAGMSRVDFLTPGVIALAIMSTAFTSQAIATGFERRYGVLKRLGATPLSRGGLIAAKTSTVIVVELLQAVIIMAVALALGWSPDASLTAIVTVPLLVLLGTAAFSGFALLMAGTLRAEATLAAANLIYVVLLGIGGVVFPLTKFPAGVRSFLEVLPTGALSTALRGVLASGAGLPEKETIALAVWAVAGIADRMFGQVPPAAMTALRLWAAALILLLVAGRPAVRVVAGIVRARAWADGVTPVSFGIALGLMNFAIYQAFARIPLGIAVTIEFLGPLTVAVAGVIGVGGVIGARRLAGAGWAALAGGGVVLLARGSGGHLNLAGVTFALLSAAGWAGYILLSRASAQRIPGSSGLVIAMCVAAAGVTGPGLAVGGSAMFRPAALGAGAAIGLLSSVIPYWLEFQALRRVPARVFGVWMSMQPAVAAVIGLLLLGQRLSAAEWAGICCVAGASAGAAGSYKGAIA